MKPCPFIQTRFLGPTDHRGSRVRAWNVNTKSSVTIPWDVGLEVLDNHAAAAQALLAKQARFSSGYSWALASYSSVGGGGYVFSCKVPSRARSTSVLVP